MRTAEEIAQAILELAPVELARFRAWFEEFEASRFDLAIQQDLLAGRLDRFAEEALTYFAKRKTNRLS